MAKPKSERSVATVSIHGAGRMTKKGRAKIASWLRMHADMLTKQGDKYTESRFTGRYIRA